MHGDHQRIGLRPHPRLQWQYELKQAAGAKTNQFLWGHCNLILRYAARSPRELFLEPKMRHSDLHQSIDVDRKRTVRWRHKDFAHRSEQKAAAE